MLLYIPVYTTLIHQLHKARIGRCGGMGWVKGGAFFSIVKLSGQFILFTKSVYPVYAESWTTCLQLQSM